MFSFPKDEILSETPDIKNGFHFNEIQRYEYFRIKKQVNLIETLMIESISCLFNSHYIKAKLQQIYLATSLKTKNFIRKKL